LIKDKFSSKYVEEIENLTRVDTMSFDQSNTNYYKSMNMTGPGTGPKQTDRRLYTFNYNSSNKAEYNKKNYNTNRNYYTNNNKNQIRAQFGDFMKMILSSKIGEDSDLDSVSDSKGENYKLPSNDKGMKKVHRYFEIDKMPEVINKEGDLENDAYRKENREVIKGKVSREQIIENFHKNNEIVETKLKALGDEATLDEIKEVFSKNIPDLMSILKCLPDDDDKDLTKRHLEECFYKIYHNSQSAAVVKASSFGNNTIPFSTNFENEREIEKIMMIKKTKDMQKKLTYNASKKNVGN